MRDRLSLIFFLLACSIGVFLYGVFVGVTRDYPYDVIRSGVVTFKTWRHSVARTADRGQFLHFSNVPRGDIAARRIERKVVADTAQTLLWSGGLNQFLEFCPDHGCLAVEIDKASGDVLHAYPYRPYEIFAAKRIESRPYEVPLGYELATSAYPVGIARYADGDLLVVFQTSDTFPFGVGVVRIDRYGHPRWVRHDYSHHWPTILRNGSALVPGTHLRKTSLVIKLSSNKHLTMKCKSGTFYADMVQIIAPNGTTLREIPVLDAVINSPYRAVLEQSTDACDPVHLNFIQLVDENLAHEVPGLSPGDFIVSLRNISAFGFLDKEDGHLKRLVRGTFLQQHAVHHLRDGAFLMFDNHGGNAEGGPSRLLEVDLVTGRETTIFPTRGDGKELQSLFSLYSGAIDFSADRKRVIVTFAEEAKAFEIRLRDGKILTEFNNLHDVSSVGSLSENGQSEAAAFVLFGLDYVPSEDRQ